MLPSALYLSGKADFSGKSNTADQRGAVRHGIPPSVSTNNTNESATHGKTICGILIIVKTITTQERKICHKIQKVSIS